MLQKSTFAFGVVKKYLNACALQFLVLIVLSMVVSVFFRNTLIFYSILLVPATVIKNQFENIILIEKIKFRMIVMMFNAVIVAVLNAMLFFCCERSISYLVAITVIVDMITVIVYIIKMKCVPRLFQVDFKFLKEVLRFGYIPMLSALLATINYSVDIIFLKKIGDPSELGLYSLAASIINYVWLIPDAFKDVLFSRSAKKFDKNNVILSLHISLSFIFLCLFCFSFLGKILLYIIYGIDFQGSYGVTLVLLFGAFPLSLYKILGVVLISNGKRIVHFVALAISAVLNVGLNLFLIPLYGMYGAGLTSVFSYSVCGLIVLLYFSREYKVKLSELIIPRISTFKMLLGRIKR